MTDFSASLARATSPNLCNQRFLGVSKISNIIGQLLDIKSYFVSLVDSDSIIKRNEKTQENRTYLSSGQ
jgi:hypothetical protein